VGSWFVLVIVVISLQTVSGVEHEDVIDLISCQVFQNVRRN
jgi:hypothetical protein